MTRVAAIPATPISMNIFGEWLYQERVSMESKQPEFAQTEVRQQMVGTWERGVMPCIVSLAHVISTFKTFNEAIGVTAVGVHYADYLANRYHISSDQVDRSYAAALPLVEPKETVLECSMFGEWLQEKREAQGLSQQAFAKILETEYHLKIDYRVISNLENSEVFPDVKTTMAIANYFGEEKTEVLALALASRLAYTYKYLSQKILSDALLRASSISDKDNALGKWLNGRRTTSLKEIANAIKIDISQLTSIERGNRFPNLIAIAAIAKYFKVEETEVLSLMLASRAFVAHENISCKDLNEILQKAGRIICEKSKPFERSLIFRDWLQKNIGNGSFSQAELFKTIGRTERFLYRMENGKEASCSETLKTIAKKSNLDEKQTLSLFFMSQMANTYRELNINIPDAFLVTCTFLPHAVGSSVLHVATSIEGKQRYLKRCSF